MFKRILPFFMVLFSPCTVFSDISDDMDFSGYLEKRQCYQISSPNELQGSEILFRGEFKKGDENSFLFASVDFMHNEFSDEHTKLHEAYADYSFSDFNIRCGRQLIIWGNSDGLRVTDNISPVDSSEFVTRSFDETRMAVDALVFSFNRLSYSMDMLFIPVFTPSEPPDSDSPWYLEPGFSNENTKKNLPEKEFGNCEAGARIKFFLPGLDFSFSYFRGFSDNPVSFVINENGADCLYREYKREEIFGASFSKPFNDFVLRGESALFKGIYLDNREIAMSPVKTELFKWLVGADYYPGGNLTLSLQIYGENILSNACRISGKESSGIFTFSISRKFFREKLQLSSMLYFNAGDRDSYLNVSSEYELGSHIKISGGGDIFSGSGNTAYGKYNDHSQAWLRLRYSF